MKIDSNDWPEEGLLQASSEDLILPNYLIEDADSHVHLAQRAARGAVALGVRQVLAHGSNILGGIILARLLTPSQYGFFALVALFLAFLNIFGGTGFAGNLIRMHEEPSELDCRSMFTCQQIVVGTICVVLWFSAPRISALYHISANGPLFFRLTSISLFLTSLMIMPQIKMERQLTFDKLAFIEISQAIVFNIATVVLAWRGFGILAFGFGLIARSTVGAVLSNLISPWKIGVGWNWGSLRIHLKFGFALQVGQILAMLKDSITPLFVGLFLGAGPMGYATWAMSFAGFPLMVLMPLQRLYLPFFARLQKSPASLAQFLSHTFELVNGIAAPLIMLSVVLARPITRLIFGDKWLVALPLFYCFTVPSLFGPCVTPMLGLLNAIGKSQLSLLIISLVMVGTWVLGVPLTMHFGLIGFGLTIVVVQLVNLLLYWIVSRETSANPWKSYWPAWPICIAIGVLLFALQRAHPIRSIPSLAIQGILAVLAYGLVYYLVSPQQIKSLKGLLQGVG
jgi:PST family polysaccharide transporter